MKTEEEIAGLEASKSCFPGRQTKIIIKDPGMPRKRGRGREVQKLLPMPEMLSLAWLGSFLLFKFQLHGHLLWETFLATHLSECL